MTYILITVFFLAGWFCKGQHVLWTKPIPGRCVILKQLDSSLYGKVNLRCEHESGHIGPCVVKVRGQEHHFEPEFMK